MGKGRIAILAGNRILTHYQSLASSFYSIQDHMAMSTEALGGNGPGLQPDEFFAVQNLQMTASQGVVPVFRGPTPVHPIRRGLPYNENGVPDILPKFRKDVAEGRICLYECAA